MCLVRDLDLSYISFTHEIQDCNATASQLRIYYSLMLFSVHDTNRMILYLLQHFVTCSCAVNTMSNDSSEENNVRYRATDSIPIFDTAPRVQILAKSIADSHERRIVYAFKTQYTCAKHYVR